MSNLRLASGIYTLKELGLDAIGAGILRLSSAALVAQLLALAASPLILRAYLPESFGIYLAMTTLTGLGSTLVTLRYELAIQSPTSARMGAAITSVAIIASLVMTTALSIGCFLLSDVLGVWLKVGSLRSDFYFIPLMLLSGALVEILRFVHWRRRAYSPTAQAILIQAIATVAAQCVLGVFHTEEHGLLAGALLGQMAAVAWLVVCALRYPIPMASVTSLRVIANAAREYRAFPLFTAPAGFAHMSGQQMAPIAISAMFGPAVGGLYYLGSRLISAPVAVLSSAIYPTFTGLAVDLYRRDRAKLLKLYLLFVSALIVVMSPLLLLFLTGDDLFALAFGEPWRGAGILAAWIALGAIFQLAATSTSTLNALRQNHYHASWVAIHLLSTAAVILTAWSADLTPEQTVACFAAAAVFSYVCLMLINAAVLSRSARDAPMVRGAEPSPIT